MQCWGRVRLLLCVTKLACLVSYNWKKNTLCHHRGFIDWNSEGQTFNMSRQRYLKIVLVDTHLTLCVLRTVKEREGSFTWDVKPRFCLSVIHTSHIKEPDSSINIRVVARTCLSISSIDCQWEGYIVLFCITSLRQSDLLYPRKLNMCFHQRYFWWIKTPDNLCIVQNPPETLNYC